MIHTDGLTKTFRRKNHDVRAVNGVTLHIAPGELVAFLGPNGAGKSTTLRMLTSLLRPTSGTATVAGANVLTEPALVRRRIGYIGQGNGAGHSYRVIDELHLQGSFHGLTRAVATQRAAVLVEALQLDGLEKRTVSSLSGGQRRRLDVAMGLMNHPALLFLDEPSTGMDPQGRAHLWEHILAMRDELEMTMVLTTHYLEEADDMAERVIVIDHGSVIADDSPERLKLQHADDVITLAFVSPNDAELALRSLRADGHFSGALGSPRSDSIRIITDHGARELPRALYLLDAHGVRPRTASIREATLDDVFLNLTGRSLREDGNQDTSDDAPPTPAQPAPTGAGA